MFKEESGFWHGTIDLNNLVAGDIVEVQMHNKYAVDGDWTLVKELIVDVNAEDPTLRFAGIAEEFGIRIRIKQTTGTPIEIQRNFYRTELA